MHIHKRICAVAKKQKTESGEKRPSWLDRIINPCFLVSEIQIIHWNINFIAKLVATLAQLSTSIYNN